MKKEHSMRLEFNSMGAILSFFGMHYTEEEREIFREETSLNLRHQFVNSGDGE